MSPALEGRTAIITGANQGLGLEIARGFLNAGANVILCARDSNKLEAAAADLRGLCGSAQRLEYTPADVSRFEDVSALMRTALSRFSSVQILVNNAGVYGPKGPIEAVDWQDWVHTIEINLQGSVLMARALLPHFRSRHYGKIIQISGGGATGPLPYITAYAASKAAIVRFMESLAEEVHADRIDVNCIAPGALNTRLLDEVLEAGPKRVGKRFYEKALRQKETGGAPFQRGVDLAVFLASAASDGLTGKLISAVWDPWQSLPDHVDDLQSTDIYTLRRIVPKDRGMAWGDA